MPLIANFSGLGLVGFFSAICLLERKDFSRLNEPGFGTSSVGIPPCVKLATVTRRGKDCIRLNRAKEK